MLKQIHNFLDYHFVNYLIIRAQQKYRRIHYALNSLQQYRFLPEEGYYIDFLTKLYFYSTWIWNIRTCAITVRYQLTNPLMLLWYDY
jgi:hypothetical protein